MRGELFEENEIIEEEYNEEPNPEHGLQLNPLLSSDVYELQEQHMILLKYVEILEKRNDKLKEEKERLKRLIKKYEYEKEEKEFYRTITTSNL